MLRRLLLCAAFIFPQDGAAQTTRDIVTEAVEHHVLPRYRQLVSAAYELADIARFGCDADDPALDIAFHEAFDAWIGVSHITFGPAEAQGRYFALSFWPDTRGMTERGLARLIADEDSAIADPAEYATVSVAARGFYALEFLLYDPELRSLGRAAYRCALAEAIANDITVTAETIHDEWAGGFAGLMLSAGANEVFQTPDEAMRALFGALTTGLAFTADLRLGRPLGSFEAPRPNRSEARRSERSARHVELSLIALSDLARILSSADPELQLEIGGQFSLALDRLRSLDDPTFASVADPQGRVRIEVIQQRIQELQLLIATELGPVLGVAAGFNSLDGD